MWDELLHRLKDIVSNEGEELIIDPSRTKGILLDLYPHHKLAINILTDVQVLGIAIKIQKCDESLIDIRKDQWIIKLHEEKGIDFDYANWAIYAWLFVLGKFNKTPSWPDKEGIIENLRGLDSTSEKSPKKNIKINKRRKSLEESGSKIGPTLKKYDNRSKADRLFEKAVKYLNEDNDNSKTLKIVEEAILLNPEDARLYFLGFLIFQKMRCFDQARDMLEKAVKLNPSYKKIDGVLFWLRN